MNESSLRLASTSKRQLGNEVLNSLIINTPTKNVRSMEDTPTEKLLGLSLRSSAYEVCSICERDHGWGCVVSAVRDDFDFAITKDAGAYLLGSEVDANDVTVWTRHFECWRSFGERGRLWPPTTFSLDDRHLLFYRIYYDTESPRFDEAEFPKPILVEGTRKN